MISADAKLKEALDAIERQITKLHSVESLYLQLEASKKPMLSMLTLASEGKSRADREDRAQASDEYRNICEQVSKLEADYLRERRRYELLLKAYDAAHLTFKIENSAITRQGA